MPQQPDPRFIPDTQEDTRFIPDTPSAPPGKWSLSTIGESLKRGFLEGPPELKMLESWEYPGAMQGGVIGAASRASMYPVGAGVELYNKLRSFGSVPNMGLMALSAAQPEIIPYAGAVFGAQMATQIPEQVRQASQQAQETGPWSGEAIGKYGEVGLNALMTGGAVGGAAKYKARQVGRIAEPVKFTTEPGFGESVSPESATRMAGKPPSSPAIEPGLPLRPPINPALAKPLAGGEQPTILGFDSIKKPTLDTSEGIIESYSKGKIDQKTALNLLNKSYEKATPIESTMDTVDYPLTTQSKIGVAQPAGVQEVVDLMTTKQVKNIAELQKKLGLSFTKTKELWNAAKDQYELTKMPDGFYDRISTKKGKWSASLGPELPEPVKAPKTENLTYIIPKDKATAEFNKKAREDGYEFMGLTDKGDYKFTKMKQGRGEGDVARSDESIIGKDRGFSEDTSQSKMSPEHIELWNKDRGVEKISEAAPDVPREKWELEREFAGPFAKSKPEGSGKTVAVEMGDRGTWISPGTQAEYEYLTNLKRAQEGKSPLPGSMELTDAQKSEFYNKFFKRKQIEGEAPPPPYRNYEDNVSEMGTSRPSIKRLETGLGLISKDGIVKFQSTEGRNPFYTQHFENKEWNNDFWSTGKFRYKNGNVHWNDKPSAEQMFKVEDYLENNGMKVKGHVRWDGTPIESKRTWDMTDFSEDNVSRAIDTDTGLVGMGIPEGGVRDVIEIFRGTISGQTPHVAGKELLQNAIDATARQPGGQVTLGFNEKANRLGVIDNGPGIPLNQVKTVYIDITGSGKRGGEVETIGELGVGKIAYLTKGETFFFETVVREADGQLYKHNFEAKPEEVMTNKVNVTSELVPEGTPTGTKTMLYVGAEEQWHGLKAYLRDLEKHSKLPTNVRIQEDAIGSNGKEFLYREQNMKAQSGLVTPGRILGEGESKGAKFKVSVPDNHQIVESNKIDAALISRGMFQGTQTLYFDRKARVPDRVVVEINPTVKGTHPDYPLTTPTRESMKWTTQRNVQDLIQKTLYDKAAKEREQELGRMFDQLIPRPGDKFALVDTQGKFTPEELGMIANNHSMGEIAKNISKLAKEIKRTLGISGEISNTGFVLEEGLRGVNVRNPDFQNRFAIFLNPISILKGAGSPKEAADAFVHVVMHETTHMIERTEGKYYTAALADTYTKFDLEKQLNARKQFEKIISVGGRYPQEILDILQSSETAFRREGVEKNVLFAEAGSDVSARGGQGRIAKGSESGGNRVVVVETGKLTPETLKRLYDEGYRHIGDNDQGNPRFQKSGVPGKVPLLESDVLPTPKEKTPKDTEVGMPREIYDLSRGLMSVDPPAITSAAFRQAMPWIGTANWFKSWKTATQSFGDKEWYEARQKQITESPLFRERTNEDGTKAPSFAKTIGIRMTDLKDVKGARLEGIKAQLAERLPLGIGKYVSASNRAFAGFLNDLRYANLEAFVQDSKALAAAHKDPKLDLTLNIPEARKLAEFINDSTGVGTLKTGWGSHQYSLEQHAQKVADIFFSPRLMASRIRMLNPSTYLFASPMIRRQYTYAMLRTIGAWWGIAQLGKMAGGTVVTDPNNPDFGKIKIGDTRLDPAAGFQQYLVLGSRIRPEWMKLPIEPTNTGIVPLDMMTGFAGTGGGQYASSISGKSRPFGEGFNPPTRTSTIIDFAAQKFHPTAKLFFDIGAVNERKPVYMMDRLMQLYVPMMTGDIAQLSQEHPELIPLVIPFSGVGGGSQTYTGEPVKPLLTPFFGLDKYDYRFGGKNTSKSF